MIKNVVGTYIGMQQHYDRIQGRMPDIMDVITTCELDPMDSRYGIELQELAMMGRARGYHFPNIDPALGRFVSIGLWLCWLCLVGGYHVGYPLVRGNINMEHPHCSWVNQRFLWPCSSSQTVSLPEGTYCISNTKTDSPSK